MEVVFNHPRPGNGGTRPIQHQVPLGNPLLLRLAEADALPVLLNRDPPLLGKPVGCPALQLRMIPQGEHRKRAHGSTSQPAGAHSPSRCKKRISLRKVSRRSLRLRGLAWLNGTATRLMLMTEETPAS